MIGVALPISRAHPDLGRAVRCVLDQQAVEVELLLIVNGPDPAAADAADRLASTDTRIRVLHRPEPGLSGALNLALGSTDAEFVARMDDDDLCPPDRFITQIRWMQDRPSLAGVGCAFGVEGPDAEPIALVRPPTEPGPLYAKLLEGNCLAHGSMMLRRKAVLDAGGYDESLDKAQDFELWLRLARLGLLGAAPDILYTHILRDPGASLATSPAQARAAAKVMADAWSALSPGLGGDEGVALIEAVASVLGATGDPASTAQLDALIDRDGPTLGAMVARLWASRRVPPVQARAVEVCRRSRLREIGGLLRDAGASGVTLWGAGAHAGWILAHASDLGLPIEGIVDDHAEGEHHGFAVRRPESLGAGVFVLIASDAHEDAIWERSAEARARGVRVFRLYGEG